MDIEKKANEFIQPGHFPGNFGNEPTFNTDGVEDGAMFTGVEEGPYGDGSKLREHEKFPARRVPPKKPSKRVVVAPDGTISMVDVEERKMFDPKALKAYILKRLAADETPAEEPPAEVAPEAQPAAPKPANMELMDMLGVSTQEMPTEEFDQAVEEILGKLSKADLRSMYKAAQELEVFQKQLETEYSAKAGVTNTFNQDLTRDENFIGTVAGYAASFKNKMMANVLGASKETFVRLSVLHKIMDSIGVTIKHMSALNPKRTMAKTVLKTHTVGPDVSEASLEAMKKTMAQKVAQYKFIQSNQTTMEDVGLTVMKALKIVEEATPKAQEAATQFVASIDVGAVAEAKMKQWDEAYKELISQFKALEKNFPKVQSSVAKVEAADKKVKDAGDKVAGVDEPTAEGLLAFMDALQSGRSELIAEVDAVEQLTASTQELSATEPATQAPEPVSDEEPFAPAPEEGELPQREQAAIPALVREAAEGFVSVLSKLEALDSEVGWEKVAPAAEKFNSSVEKIVSKAEAVYEELEEAQAELSELASEMEAEPEAEVEEAEAIPMGEFAPAMAADKKNLSKAAAVDNQYVPGEEYRAEHSTQEQELERLTPEQAKAKGEAARQELAAAIAPVEVAVGAAKMLEVASTDVSKVIENSKAKMPSEHVQAQMDKIAQAIRLEMAKPERQAELEKTPDLKSAIKILEKEVPPKVAAAKRDLYKEFIKALESLGSTTSMALAKFVQEHEVEIVHLIGGGYMLMPTIQKGPSKEGPVSFEEIFELVDDSSNGLMLNLEREISHTDNELVKQHLVKFRNMLLGLRRQLLTAEKDQSPESRAKALEQAKAIVQQFEASKEKAGVQATPLKAFVDMLKETLTPTAPETPSAAASLAGGVFNIGGLVAQAELSTEEIVETIMDILWPGIKDIINSHTEEVSLLLENLLSDAEGVETLEPMPQQELELATASDTGKMERKADTEVIAPIAPNDMYSHFDLSENTIELRDEDGKKRLYINKSLKNLVTKRMNEFLKGAHKEGDVLAADLGDRVVTATVKQYLGNNEYEVTYENGYRVRIHENKLFKL